MSEPFNVKKFSLQRDNILIAPAGFGKTHTISECLAHTEGRQLILTHTQAGVASIRDKLQKSSILKEKYTVETIDSFAQKYVRSFYNSLDIPDEFDKDYYPFFIRKATEILSLSLVKDIIKISYTGLFVDEYQDCRLEQHNLVLILADILPTHILGDPLQGIFNFKGQKLIDLNDPIQMGRFKTTHKLETPHRWINGGNPKLGEDILKIRGNLLSRSEVNLAHYPSIEFKKGIYRNHYTFIIDLLTKEESVLVIDPNSMNTSARENFVIAFKDIPVLIEAFDSKDFYLSAQMFDNHKGFSTITVLHNFICKYFSNLDIWYDKKKKKFKTKRNSVEEDQLTDIKRLVRELELKNSLITMRDLIFKIKNLKGINCARRDLLHSLSVSMESAHSSNITVIEAMRNHRNHIRRVGRKMYGKYIGTTLLTKGLEFDTVIILDADNFKDPNNFYVALSRCSKRLVVLSGEGKLNPYAVS